MSVDVIALLGAASRGMEGTRVLIRRRRWGWCEDTGDNLRVDGMTSAGWLRHSGGHAAIKECSLFCAERAVQ